MSVSILIPARNEKYLEKTIRNVLENAEEEIEVLVALDGWLPEQQIHIGDDRVIFYHFKEPIGHLKATNELAQRAKHKFIMKLDAHCAVGKGFDRILKADCEYEWTVIPRMYNLDIETWKPKLFDDFGKSVRMGKLHDYIMLGVIDKNGRTELRTQYYPHSVNKKLHYDRKDILIDETMSCMGCCFFMHKDRFFELDGCDTSEGRLWGQQAVEIACKAWLSGGKLMVNKKTWFAHWFRAGDGPTGGGFPYPISGNHINRVRNFYTDFWVNDKWPKAKRKFHWLIDKFNGSYLAQEKKEPIKVNENVNSLIRNVFNCRAHNHPSPIAARKGDRNSIVQVWARAGYKEGAEIGVFRGHFSSYILETVPDVKLHCIDPWATYENSQLTEEHQRRNEARTLKRLDPYIKSGKCVIHKEYSEKASEKFKDGSLDFILIDADHSFDGCALDLIKWVPKVRKGGMVAVHDYCAMNRNGVVKAVDAYTYCHMIHPWFVTREVINTAFWVVK